MGLDNVSLLGSFTSGSLIGEFVLSTTIPLTVGEQQLLLYLAAQDLQSATLPDIQGSNLDVLPDIVVVDENTGRNIPVSNTDPCFYFNAISYCLNGAVCSGTDTAPAQCVCTSGFIGDDCSVSTVSVTLASGVTTTTTTTTTTNAGNGGGTTATTTTNAGNGGGTTTTTTTASPNQQGNNGGNDGSDESDDESLSTTNVIVISVIVPIGALLLIILTTCCIVYCRKLQAEEEYPPQYLDDEYLDDDSQQEGYSVYSERVVPARSIARQQGTLNPVYWRQMSSKGHAEYYSNSVYG